MFHVSTLLPFIPGDRQQLERKRHIGNDIVVIVFQESDLSYGLTSITSHQNHVVAVVKPEGDGYRWVFPLFFELCFDIFVSGCGQEVKC